MNTGTYLPLQCQLYADFVGGKVRWKGAVTDGQSVLWEGKWRHTQMDAIAEAENSAARIDRERRKRVLH